MHEMAIPISTVIIEGSIGLGLGLGLGFRIISYA